MRCTGSSAEIHEYILKNWRMVKVATTKAQRKLFFNLRSMKQGLKEQALDADTHRNTLTPAEVATMARELNVKPEEVVEMETRLTGGDVALEPQNDDGEESYAPIAYLADDSSEPTRRLEARHRDWLSATASARAGLLDATQPPHRRRALAEGQRRQLGRHDAARTGRRIRRQRRAHPPDRGGGAEEDAQGAGPGLRAGGSAGLSQQQLQVVRQRLGAAAIAREQAQLALRVEDIAARGVVDGVAGRSCPAPWRIEDLELLGQRPLVSSGVPRRATKSGRSW
jgi:hypothetical protein